VNFRETRELFGDPGVAVVPAVIGVSTVLLLLHVPINFYRVLTLAVVPAKASVHSLCRYYSHALRHCWNVPFAVDPAVDEVLAVVGVFLLSSCLSWRPCCSWGPLLLLGSPAVAEVPAIAGVSCC
jgi:hypothetical protein